MSHIARSSLIIAFFFALDKGLSLVRQVLLARQFSVAEIEVFLASNNIPDLLSALISGGALGVAFIPVLAEYLQKSGRAAAWGLFARILNLAFLVTGGLALLIFLFARPLIVYVVVPGFTPAQHELAIGLMRLDLVAIMIFSISGLVMAGLQANQHFIFPALAPVVYDLGQLIGLLFFAPLEPVQLGPLTLPTLGLGVWGLVWGVILGASLHLLIQVPGLLRYQFRWQPVLGLADAGVRQVLRLMGPRVATMLFIQIIFVARDNIGSRLGEGGVTAINYGWFLMQVPQTLIGTALAIAVLPTLAEQVARREDSAFRETLNKAIRTLLALTIPTAALMSVGVEPIVAILGFDSEVAGMVVAATRGYMLGVIGHSLLEIAVRSFYARHDALTPLKTAGLNAVLFILLSAGLSLLLGPGGVALGDSLAFTLQALLLLTLLHKRVPGFLAVRPTLLRSAGGALVGSALVVLVLALVPYQDWGRLYQALLGVGVLGAGFLAALPFIWTELKMMVKL